MRFLGNRTHSLSVAGRRKRGRRAPPRIGPACLRGEPFRVEQGGRDERREKEKRRRARLPGALKEFGT